MHTKKTVYSEESFLMQSIPQNKQFTILNILHARFRLNGWIFRFKPLKYISSHPPEISP